MPSLLVITGPPGAGKSTVARAVADAADGRSVLVEADRLHGFLARGAITPWAPEAREQNEVVTLAAAAAAGRFAAAGFTTVYDGVVVPPFLPAFADATGLDRLDVVVLLPPVGRCLERIRSRRDHGFADAPAARDMHVQFATAELPARHVLTDVDDGDVAALVARVASARRRGDLAYAQPR